jgi:hypothetical protein
MIRFPSGCLFLRACITVVSGCSHCYMILSPSAILTGSFEFTIHPVARNSSNALADAMASALANAVIVDPLCKTDEL